MQTKEFIERMAVERAATQSRVITLDDAIFGVSVSHLPADKNVSRGGGCGEPRRTVNIKEVFEEELAEFNHDFGLGVEFGPLLQPVRELTHNQASILASIINRNYGEAEISYPEDAVMSMAYVRENLL